MAAVRFLAELDDVALREALVVWAHESPDKAARLYDLLTGRAEPAWKTAGIHDPDRGASYDRQ